MSCQNRQFLHKSAHVVGNYREIPNGSNSLTVDDFDPTQNICESDRCLVEIRIETSNLIPDVPNYYKKCYES